MPSIHINTMVRCLPRQFSSYRPGQYSRMMDMGGVPQTKSSIKLNFGQKNKIQAIALDFNLITRAVDEAKSEGVNVGTFSKVTTSKPGTCSDTPGVLSSSATSFFGKSSAVSPNVGLVQDIANLLKVKIGEEDPSKMISSDEPDEATLANLFSKTCIDDEKREKNDYSKSASSSIAKKSSAVTTSKLLPSAMTDIRSKYASKLQKKIDGGASSLDRQKEERLSNRGDASSHLAARAIATKMNNPNNTTTGPARWLAASGTSKLLSFISSRSMKIALLPIPRSQHADPAQTVLPEAEEEGTCNSTGKAMDELSHQLPQVQFHLLIKTGDGKEPANQIVKQVQDAMSKDHGILPINTIIVSDRDDYLREGRDMGFYTCRIRPKNFRRGNVTTNFTTETIAEVEDVINELNGLSMNSVLTGTGS